MTAPLPPPLPPPPPLAPAREVAIRGTGITKSWGTNRVLDGASFTIGRGVTGLLGSNGAGKTTMFGMVLGLHRPDSGTFEVLGLDPADAGPEIRARIGYAPEHHMLPPDMRAHDLVRHLAEIHGLPRREATTRASDALWQVGLGEERFRALGTMSTGQRQRVKLAQALAHDPAMVLLDEPTDGLDPVQRDDMLALIRRIGTEFGIDVVLSSHLLEEVERICDGVVILNGGRVAASGSLDELRGTSSGVVAELDSDVVTVAAQLTSVGWTVSVSASTLTVEVQGSVELTLDAVRDAIANVGAPLRSLHPRRVSLEQIFLREVS
ncbi:MAG: ABC transporter ATP-binding protein [Acidimicrobiia bacterium]|nr:ABC transporter ATP-binding protein [Acidimicrobiia bacterium]